jgi:hypothetical protein
MCVKYVLPELRVSLAYKANMKEIKKKEEEQQDNLKIQEHYEIINREKCWFDPDYIGNLVNLFL